jgi:hypothetical protein
MNPNALKLFLTEFGLNTASYSNTEKFSQGIKRLRREADHSPSNVGVKN